MVESYLHENDLLAGTPEGVAYRRFARMLSSSTESATIQRDLDHILDAPFAQEHMTPGQRRTRDAHDLQRARQDGVHHRKDGA
jgi:hypothetical protein